MPATASCRIQLAMTVAFSAFIRNLLGRLDGGAPGRLQAETPGHARHLNERAWARRAAVLIVRTGNSPLAVGSRWRLRSRSRVVPYRTEGGGRAARAGGHQRAGTAGGRRF